MRVCRVHLATFYPVQQWLWQVEELWRGQLQAFKVYAKTTTRVRKSKL